jgi:hypothetical protein
MLWRSGATTTRKRSTRTAGAPALGPGHRTLRRSSSAQASANAKVLVAKPCRMGIATSIADWELGGEQRSEPIGTASDDAVAGAGHVGSSGRRLSSFEAYSSFRNQRSQWSGPAFGSTAPASQWPANRISRFHSQVQTLPETADPSLDLWVRSGQGPDTLRTR